MSSYTYWGNCSQSTYEDITLLRESAKRISWRSFKKVIQDAREMLEQVGAIWPETTDKQIETSGFLDFNTGIFMGRPAYFIDWSAIEWIWVKAEKNPRPLALSRKEEDEIIAAYESGMSQAKTGKVFGVSHATVGQILKRRGVKAKSPSRRFFTQEQEEEVALHYAAGMSIPEIASMFGTSVTTIRSALIRQDVPLRSIRSDLWKVSHRALSRKEEDEATSAYESGMTLAEIGEVFGVDQTTVGQFTEAKRRAGKKIWTKGLSEEQEKALIGAYLSGSSGVVLAEAFGVARKTVYDILERHGIKKRESGSHMMAKKGFPDVSQHVIRPEDMPYLTRLYREGLSLEEIAEMFGVHLTTISATLKRYGYEVRPKGRPWGGKEHVITGLEPQIVEDYLSGMTEEQLVQKYAITPREIKEAIDRHLGAKMQKAKNPAGSVSTALAVVSVSFLAIGLGFALRSAKMHRRRDPGPGRTAAIGNSITASSTGYVAFLGRAMPSRTFVNMGVVGEGTAAIKRRLERNVIGQQFDEVIIEAGINDIRRNDAATYIPSQLAEMVRIAKQSGLKVVLTTLPPWRGAVAAIASVNSSIKRDGKFWGADVVVDIHRPLTDWRGHLRGELVGDQMGLHPNRQGQELIGRAILESAYQ